MYRQLVGEIAGLPDIPGALPSSYCYRYTDCLYTYMCSHTISMCDLQTLNSNGVHYCTYLMDLPVNTFTMALNTWTCLSTPLPWHSDTWTCLSTPLPWHSTHGLACQHLYHGTQHMDLPVNTFTMALRHMDLPVNTFTMAFDTWTAYAHSFLRLYKNFKHRCL